MLAEILGSERSEHNCVCRSMYVYVCVYMFMYVCMYTMPINGLLGTELLACHDEDVNACSNMCVCVWGGGGL